MPRFRPLVALWIVTVIWTASVAGMWAHYEMKGIGREIDLKTVPIDPRDLLRGEYVALRYEISRIPGLSDRSALLGLRKNQTLYVQLEQVNREWQVRRVLVSPPEKGALFLKGRVRELGSNGLEMVYGIESFFVPEGMAKKFEEAREHNRLYARVNVNARGEARIKALHIR